KAGTGRMTVGWRAIRATPSSRTEPAGRVTSRCGETYHERRSPALVELGRLGGWDRGGVHAPGGAAPDADEPLRHAAGAELPPPGSDSCLSARVPGIGRGAANPRLIAATPSGVKTTPRR